MLADRWAKRSRYESIRRRADCHSYIGSCALHCNQRSLGCATIERLKCSSPLLPLLPPPPSLFFSLYATRTPGPLLARPAFTADLNGIRDRNVFPVRPRNLRNRAAVCPSTWARCALRLLVFRLNEPPVEAIRPTSGTIEYIGNHSYRQALAVQRVPSSLSGARTIRG